MIENYFTCIKALKISKIKKIFLVLSICSLIDLILSTMIWLNRTFDHNINCTVFNLLMLLSTTLFFVFIFKYGVSNKIDFKFKKVYVFLMLAFITISAITYMIWMNNNEVFALKLWRLFDSLYSLARLIFVFHQGKYIQDN